MSHDRRSNDLRLEILTRLRKEQEDRVKKCLDTWRAHFDEIKKLTHNKNHPKTDE